MEKVIAHLNDIQMPGLPWHISTQGMKRLKERSMLESIYYTRPKISPDAMFLEVVQKRTHIN